jgi:Spy/CpxP family protein refolding chaperone
MTNVIKNRWQVRIAALIIFVLGFTAGILALNVYRRARPLGGGGSRMDELSDRLKLTPDQKTKVQEIFSDTREQIRTVRSEMEPKMNEIRRQADGRLQTVLTPEQWQQFQKLRDERQRRGPRGPADEHRSRADERL